MGIQELEAKKAFYITTLTDIQTIENIDVEVEKRFEEKKSEIRIQVINEVNEKVKKCQNYIDLLDELIDEYETTSEIVENTTEQ